MAVDKAMWTERARTLTFFVLALSFVVLIALVLAANAHADTTFTVDRSDDSDLTTTPTADDCTTATANDCSLRGAITAASNTSGADTINFAIPEDPNDPANGVKTIRVDGTADPATSTNLPDISEAVTINGYTQRPCSSNPEPCSWANRSAVGTDADLLVVLDGANPGSSDIGSTINASDVVVRGLVITRFPTGIFIPAGGSGAVIRGNFIGTDSSGTTTINGTLISLPRKTFIIQFFLQLEEGPLRLRKTFLGQVRKKTNLEGRLSFSFTTVLPTGENVVTAAATKLNTSTVPATPTDTSEFSRMVRAS